LKIFEPPTLDVWIPEGFTEMVDRLVSYQRLWNVIFTTQAVSFFPADLRAESGGSMVYMDLT
jgi:hypothetical protein